MLHSAVPPRKNAFAADLVSMLVGGIRGLVDLPVSWAVEAENQREKHPVLEIDVFLELLQDLSGFLVEGNGAFKKWHFFRWLAEALGQELDTVFKRLRQSFHHLAMILVLLLKGLQLCTHMRAAALDARREDESLFLVEVLLNLSPPQG